jgi:hypothetical protein
MAVSTSPLNAPTLPAAPDSRPGDAGEPSGWRRWLQRQGPGTEFGQLARAREAFADSLADLPALDVQALRRLLASAGSLRELWYLRPEVFRTVALHRSQGEAERRLEQLDRLLARRSGASGFLPLRS